MPTEDTDGEEMPYTLSCPSSCTAIMMGGDHTSVLPGLIVSFTSDDGIGGGGVQSKFFYVAL